MYKRKFNVLIVEDDNSISQYISNEFLKLGDDIEITIATCRNEAIKLLENNNNFFDYITLDLTLPINSDDFEKNPENGLHILSRISEISKGTPILILTATSTIDMIQDFLSHSCKADIWGDKEEISTIMHLSKLKINSLNEIINKIYTAFSKILSVEMRTNQSLTLPIEHDRLIRIFANSVGGSTVKIKKIGGGLSDAKVYAVEVEDINGAKIYNSICKCGEHVDISTDAQNYTKYINRLAPDASPRILGYYQFGAKSSYGVFYGFAENHNDSFFKAMCEKNISQELFTAIKSLFTPWYNASTNKNDTIANIRRMLINDEKTEELIKQYNIESCSKRFEKKNVTYKHSCIHSDLHGENILLNTESKKAVLIDYGDINEGAIILDIITLECSSLFHPSIKDYLDLGEWPTDIDINNWSNEQNYISNCPFPDSVTFCRSWLYELDIGNREIAAGLYSYSLRQLKYPETNKRVAISLIKKAYELYELS